MSQPTLFLLDDYALIYRAYFAFQRAPRITSTNINTSAIYGFTNSLIDILRNQKPSHIAIVFDTHAPTFRHIQYPLYKAQREAQPEDIGIAIPYIHRIAEAWDIPCLSMDGFEADDVIGTLAVRAAAEGFKVYMMTPDKDYGQLVTDNILQYKPGNAGKPAEVWGPAEVCHDWEINTTSQVIDALGLMGDAVDNIPGIKGVGKKTAAKLLQEYHTLENILDNAHQLKGKLAQTIADGADSARLSKELATIHTSVPIDCDFDRLAFSFHLPQPLMDVFEELEFKTLITNLRKGEAGSSQKSSEASDAPRSNGALFDQPSDEDSATEHTTNLQTAATVSHFYTPLTTVDECVQLAIELMKHPIVAFDTETTGLNALTANLVGLSFSFEVHHGYYVALPKDRADQVPFLDAFKEFWLNHTCIVGQNIKYDILMLKQYGYEVGANISDTMLAHYLLEPDQRHNMDYLAQSYLGYQPISIETLIGSKGKGQKSMADVPLETITEYAAEDADITLQLHQILHPKLSDSKAIDIFRDIEIPLINTLAEMEFQGIKLDSNALAEYSKELLVDIQSLEATIYDHAGTRFNINSPTQVGEILFDRLKLDPKAKRTGKSKQYATGEEILQKLSHAHPIVSDLLSYRQLQKLKSTYVDSLPNLVNPTTGRIHTTFQQAVASTGRLSSSDPNLQNIPIRSDKGREIRRAFIPRSEEYTILSADYSQIELRLMAAVAQDEAMIQAFVDKIDIHTATAAKIYNTSIDQVDSSMRRNAKMVNFGIIYGISAFGLSQRLSIPPAEAKEIISSYHAQYPGIATYMAKIIESARDKGYVETILGRRRYLRDINSSNHTVRSFAERNAINAPIQGSAADLVKLAMNRIHHKIKELKLQSRMLLQVHDELVFDAYLPELPTLMEMVKFEMENAQQLPVPIEVEMGSGPSWLQAH